MKQLLILLIAITLFTACNNNNNGLKGGSWSSAEKQTIMKQCTDGVAGKLDDDQAKTYCSCVVEKAMAKYPTFASANKATEEDGTKLGEACMAEMQGGGGGDEPKKKSGGLFGGGGGGWSKTDKNTFLNSCATSLEGHAKADQICSCVLEKLEKKYADLKEADRLGGEEAGKKLAQECSGAGGDDDN